MKQYFEYSDYNSHKFWQIEVKGNGFTVLYGKIGSDGREQTKTFKDEAEAMKEAKKAISQKIKKGYVRKLEPSATPYKKGMKIDPTKAYKFFQDYEATDGTTLEQLQDFITQENCDKVKKIVIGMWGEHDDTPAGILEFLIANKSKFTSVTHFFFGDIESEENEMSWIEQTSYEAFLKEFSHIEKLELKGGNSLELGKINLPNLKMLRIETGGMDNVILEQLIMSKDNLPNLEHLELWLGTEDYGASIQVETVKDLISGNNFPNLKHLGLMNSDIQDDIVKLFENNPIIDRLDSLDFSMGTLSKEGGESLLNNDKLLSLQSLRCVFNYMPNDMIKELSNKFPNGDFDRSWADYEEEQDYWYVEVGE